MVNTESHSNSRISDGASVQEVALRTLCDTTPTAEERTFLLKKIVDASWAYHALTLIKGLSTEDKGYLVSRIVDSSAGASWAFRVLTYHRQLEKSRIVFLNEEQLRTLGRAFG